MGFMKLLSQALVLGGLISGIVLNVLVTTNCEFMKQGVPEDASYKVRLGVFRYSVFINTGPTSTPIENDPSPTGTPTSSPSQPQVRDRSLQATSPQEFDTNGECTTYEGGLEDLEWQVQTAQVCGIIAPVCGAILVLLVLLSQCCFPIPCSGPIVSMAFVGAQVGTALVWLIRRNDLCDSLMGGCEWGDGAWLNLAAQIAYLVAAFAHRFLPDPKLLAESRRANKAEGALQQQQEAKPNGMEQAPTAANSTVANEQVTWLQAQLNEQIKMTVEAETRANKLQSQYTSQTADLEKQAAALEKQRNALAAATAAASTAAAAEAAKIQELNQQIDKQQKELVFTKQQLKDSEEDAKQMKVALGTTTAVTSTAAVAEGAKIQQLQRELEKQQKELEFTKQQLQDSEEAAKQAKVALGTATAAASTAAAAEAAKIQELNHQVEKQQKLLEFTKQQLQDSEEDAKQTKVALRTATAAMTTAAAAEAAKIKQLQEELEKQTQNLEEAKKAMQDLKEENGNQKTDLRASAPAAIPVEVQNEERFLEVRYSTKDGELHDDHQYIGMPSSSNPDVADPDGIEVMLEA